jgi:hypothetical protein
MPIQLYSVSNPFAQTCTPQQVRPQSVIAQLCDTRLSTSRMRRKIIIRRRLCAKAQLDTLSLHPLALFCQVRRVLWWPQIRRLNTYSSADSTRPHVFPTTRKHTSPAKPHALRFSQPSPTPSPLPANETFDKACHTSLTRSRQAHPRGGKPSTQSGNLLSSKNSWRRSCVTYSRASRRTTSHMHGVELSLMTTARRSVFILSCGTV